MNLASLLFLALASCLLSFCGGVIVNAIEDDDTRSDNATLALLAATCLVILLVGYVAALLLQ